jgi:hypothetical protein
MNTTTTTMVEQLETKFFFIKGVSMSSKMIKGNEYISIKLPMEKVVKGFAMVTFGGTRLNKLEKLIEKTHFVNSITTILYNKELQTQILICSNGARKDGEDVN